MANTAHTPGPWAVHHIRAYVVPSAHAARPIGAAEDDDCDLATYAQEICAMHWPDRHRTENEVLANARLIAAAPEMLEALRRAERYISDDQPDEEGSLLKAIRAAIAKAEGR